VDSYREIKTIQEITRTPTNENHSQQMKHKLLQLVCIGVIFFATSLSICAQSKPAGSAKSSEAKTRNTIFVFHTDEFWLNLHHFLYVLGRAENKERDTAREAVSGAPADQERGLEKLNETERRIWRDAVLAYAAGPSKKDMVFDNPMPAITNALARAGDAKSLTGVEIDPVVGPIVQRAAPIYRKAWWKEHREANRTWQKEIDALVDRHGPAVLAFITNAYKLSWPVEGFPVHVSAYSNWAGAYSTDGNLLVVASQSPGLKGAYGFETVFHEGMHQWDEQVFEALREQAVKANKFFPKGLSHSMIFFTAGDAVRRVVPGHVPYAEKFGVWQRGLGPMKVALEEVWKPYLDGKGTREEAFRALVERTAVTPPGSKQ
jgi:hypothetical protein